MIEGWIDMIIEAPSPWSTREATSSVKECEIVQKSEPRMKIPSPTRQTRRGLARTHAGRAV
jgi:hypothetical protein